MRLLIIILFSMYLGAEISMYKYNIESFSWFITIGSFILVIVYANLERRK